MDKVLVINGPNLNMLGTRDPAIYGSGSLKEVEQLMNKAAAELDVELDFFQSNHEGELIDKIQSAVKIYSGIVINPGAFTHYSYALMDAMSSVSVPFVEIHISNIYAREEFRHKSVLTAIALGQISGMGIYGYELALRGLVHKLRGSTF